MIPTIQNKKIVRGRAVPWVLGLFLACTAIFAVFTAQTAHAQIDYEDPQNYDATGTTAADTNPGPAQSVTPKTTTPAPPSTCGVLSLCACVSAGPKPRTTPEIGTANLCTPGRCQ